MVFSNRNAGSVSLDLKCRDTKNPTKPYCIIQTIHMYAKSNQSVLSTVLMKFEHKVCGAKHVPRCHSKHNKSQMPGIKQMVYRSHWHQNTACPSNYDAIMEMDGVVAGVLVVVDAEVQLHLGVQLDAGVDGGDEVEAGVQLDD